MTFLVAPVNDLVRDADAVGRHRKAKVFVVLFLDAACIGNQLLADFEVHQRLTAEEIDLQIAAGAGVFDQKVQSALAGLKAHQAGLAVELALRGKAVAAVQVAGVGHMQAERLDHIGTVFKVKGVVGVGIGRKQLAGGGQLVNVVQHIIDVVCRDIARPAYFWVRASAASARVLPASISPMASYATSSTACTLPL